MKSIFEEMGGTYRQEGDYLIPNLELLPIPDYKIGKYGRMHRNYLKEHRKVLYTNLILDGTLFERYCKTPLPSVWKKAQTIPIIF